MSPLELARRDGLLLLELPETARMPIDTIVALSPLFEGVRD